jgi:enamine deaminase RidA (YjgF/YER057c/UK114 family)
MTPEEKLADLGLVLPAEPKLPPNVTIPFQWVRIHGARCFLSGHGALGPGGAPSPPFGRVPSEVSLEDAQGSARSAALAMLAAMRRSIGGLDRVRAWLVVNAFINADEAYPHTTAVVNPASELILDVFGPDAGAHARTAIGVRALPMNLPVILTAEVAIAE